MTKFPTPITAENFNEADSYITAAIIKSKSKALIRKIAKPVGSLIFTLFSFLLVFGLFFELSSPEEMIVFEKLDSITKVWTKFSGLFFTAETEWYIFWPVLIAIAFVVPLLISAIITVAVTVCHKAEATEVKEGTEAEKAKALHEKAGVLASLTASDTKTGIRSLCIWLFIAAVVAVLVVAFLTLKIGFSLGMIIGFAVVVALVYFVYGIIFNLFDSLNSLFYKNSRSLSFTKETDEYWLKVDPDEKKRREEEAERIAREAEAARIALEGRRQRAAEIRIEALSAERSGQYSTAKRMFKEAAEMGDALAMDNYARHCLINGNRSDAIYWLERSIKTGEADSQSEALLQALKAGQHIDVHYN